MPAAIETRIFRLHHEADVSTRIGYLASQQRLAYNHAVDVLNRTPDIALLKSPRNPDGLLGQMTLWRRQDERADAPYIIHQSGVQQAWLANSLMKQERKARLTRLDSGSTRSSDHRQHRRTLAHRSRKRGYLQNPFSVIVVEYCCIISSEHMFHKTSKPHTRRASADTQNVGA